MELRLLHMHHLFNVFRENDGKENYAQLIEDEFYKFCWCELFEYP